MEFKDINEPFEKRQPSLEMFFNEQELHEKFDGFRILNVGGRGFLLDNVNHEQLPDQDGAFISSQNLPPRILTIQYELISESDEAAREQYNEMNRFLRSKSDAVTRFSDEPDKIYYSRFYGAEQPPMGRLSYVSTFQLFCQDPFKYEDPEDASDVSSVYLPYPIRPSGARIVLTSAAESVTLLNETTGQRIVLNGSYGNGDELIIDFNGRRITRNGEPITKDLDYTVSDFMSFRINNGDQVSASTGTLTMTVRRKWL